MIPGGSLHILCIMSVDCMHCKYLFLLCGLLFTLLKVSFVILKLVNFNVVSFLKFSFMGSTLCVLF